MNLDFLDEYRILDLMALRDEVQSRIEAMRGKAIETLRRDTLAEANFLGISLSELLEAQESPVPSAKGNGKEPLPAKYRDPASGKTWSGKGKRPGWFDAARIDELRI